MLRTHAHRHPPIPCVRLGLFGLGGCRVAAHSTRTPICTKIEWGGRSLSGHHMLHGPPTRASCIGISQQWRASSTDGNSGTPAQVSSKDESINLTCLGRAATNSAEGYRQRSAFWAFQNARCPLLAQSRHAQCADECPLLGAKRTLTNRLLTNLDL
jgi:hypothetical protein